MPADMRLRSINFSDGTRVPVGTEDIVLVVGPNNAGKSLALRECSSLPFEYQDHYRVVKRVGVLRTGTGNELKELMIDRGVAKREQFDSNDDDRVAHPSMVGWDNPSPVLAVSNWRHLFVQYLEVGSRLQAQSGVPNIDPSKDRPTNALQLMAWDPEVDARVNKIVRSAFDGEIIVKATGGQNLSVHFGDRPARCPNESPQSITYNRKLNQVPLLSEQGDGVRSFTSIVLSAELHAWSVLLIDEPEVLLHPPQVRRLAEYLATSVRNRQLVIATHSLDFVKTMLSVAPSRLRIVRLQRDGAVNRATVLAPDRVTELLSDPLLEASGVLDGLFHERVVVCEGDADVKFYSAVARAMQCDRDAMFCHVGGKGRLYKAVLPLLGLNVRVSVIADFDFLQDKSKVKQLVDCMGGDWPSLEPLWNVVSAACNSKSPRRPLREVDAEIRKVLDSLRSEADWTPACRNKVSEVMKSSEPWAEAKKHGINALSGDPRNKCTELIRRLDQIGIHVVSTGELESHDRSIAGDSGEWAVEAVKRNLLSKEYESARVLVKAVFGDRT